MKDTRTVQDKIADEAEEIWGRATGVSHVEPSVSPTGLAYTIAWSRDGKEPLFMTNAKTMSECDRKALKELQSYRFKKEMDLL